MKHRLLSITKWTMAGLVALTPAIFVIRSPSRYDSISICPTTTLAIEIWSASGDFGIEVTSLERKPTQGNYANGYQRGVYLNSNPIDEDSWKLYSQFLDTGGQRESFLGFWTAHLTLAGRTGRGSVQSQSILAGPNWLFLCISAVPLLIFTFRTFRKHQRIRQGRCPVCGYDLRYSFMQCPECGTPGPISPPRLADAVD